MEACVASLHRGKRGVNLDCYSREPSRFSQRCLSPTPAASLLKRPAAPGRRLCKNRRGQVRSYLTDRDRDTARSSTRKARKGDTHHFAIRLPDLLAQRLGSTTTLGRGHPRLRDRDLGKNSDLAKITYGATMARVGEISLEH